MGGYTSKCEKKSKSLHPTGHVKGLVGQVTGVVGQVTGLVG
jgi:hypothetical protein